MEGKSENEKERRKKYGSLLKDDVNEGETRSSSDKEVVVVVRRRKCDESEVDEEEEEEEEKMIVKRMEQEEWLGEEEERSIWKDIRLEKYKHVQEWIGCDDVKMHMLMDIKDVRSVRNVHMQHEDVISNTLSSEKLVLLDMDETLVHTEVARKDGKYDGVVHVKKGERVETYGVWIRPYVQEMLQQLKKLHVRIGVFSAGAHEYVHALVLLLDPLRNIFERVYTRNHCLLIHDRFFVKNLSLVDVHPHNVLLVDNLMTSFAFHLYNGVPILPYTGKNRKDKQLLLLARLLKDIHLYLTLRLFLQHHLKLHSFYDFFLALPL